MWDWLNEYKEELGAFVVGVGGVFAVVWSKLQSMQTERAKTGADVAIAQSQREVYEQMKERLTEMSLQIERLTAGQDDLRSQLRAREDEIHRLRLHVKDLEHVLQTHGLPVPQMV